MANDDLMDELSDWIKKENYFEVKRMLQNPNLDVNQENRLCQLPLELASIYDQVDMVSLLIEAGADVNGKSTASFSPLIHAVSFERGDVVKLLLEKGADCHQTDFLGRTALHYAVVSQDPELVKVLLEVGANPYVMDQNGETPMVLIENAKVAEAFEEYERKRLMDECKDIKIETSLKPIRI